MTRKEIKAEKERLGLKRPPTIIGVILLVGLVVISAMIFVPGLNDSFKLLLQQNLILRYCLWGVVLLVAVVEIIVALVTTSTKRIITDYRTPEGQREFAQWISEVQSRQ